MTGWIKISVVTRHLSYGLWFKSTGLVVYVVFVTGLLGNLEIISINLELPDVNIHNVSK